MLQRFGILLARELSGLVVPNPIGRGGNHVLHERPIRFTSLFARNQRPVLPADREPIPTCHSPSWIAISVGPMFAEETLPHGETSKKKS
jgi:hypothetical protein